MKRRELFERGMTGGLALAAGAIGLPALAGIGKGAHPVPLQPGPLFPAELAVDHHLWFQGEEVRLYPVSSQGWFRIVTGTTTTPAAERSHWDGKYRLRRLKQQQPGQGVWADHGLRFLELDWEDRTGQLRRFCLQEPVALSAVWGSDRSSRDSWQYVRLRPGVSPVTVLKQAGSEWIRLPWQHWEGESYQRWAEELLFGRSPDTRFGSARLPKEWRG
jgi:hypothetical protein